MDHRNLNDLRVVDLKKELELRGLSKSGSKKELVDRLKAVSILPSLLCTSLDTYSNSRVTLAQLLYVKLYTVASCALVRLISILFHQS